LRREARPAGTRPHTPGRRPADPFLPQLRQSVATIFFLNIGNSRILDSCNLLVDRPDFEQQAAFQAGVTLGDLRRFVEVVGENEPKAADHFFGFAERAVCYHIMPRDRFTFVREPLPPLHFSLADQSIKPGVEFVNYILYFLPRKGFVPLSAGNYQVFG
jgi:hypothetical protein